MKKNVRLWLVAAGLGLRPSEMNKIRIVHYESCGKIVRILK